MTQEQIDRAIADLRIVARRYDEEIQREARLPVTSQNDVALLRSVIDSVYFAISALRQAKPSAIFSYDYGESKPLMKIAKLEVIEIDGAFSWEITSESFKTEAEAIAYYNNFVDKIRDISSIKKMVPKEEQRRQKNENR